MSLRGRTASTWERLRALPTQIIRQNLTGKNEAQRPKWSGKHTENWRTCWQIPLHSPASSPNPAVQADIPKYCFYRPSSVSLILSVVFQGTMGGSLPGKKTKQTNPSTTAKKTPNQINKNPSEVPLLPLRMDWHKHRGFAELQGLKKTHLALLKEKLESSCFSPQDMSGLKKRNS